MITRKQAIRSMAAILSTFWGGMHRAYPQSDGLTISAGSGSMMFTIDWGDKVPPKPPPPVRECPMPGKDVFDTIPRQCMEKDGSIRPEPMMFQASPTLGTEYIPGTASTSMDLGAFKYFEFRVGGDTIRVTREEMWEALKS